jgi:hypothetical protein
MSLPEEKLTRPNEEAQDYFDGATPSYRKILGKRNKLGGEPDWIQQPARVVCDSCGREMSFYGQLDSISPDIMLGDAGLAYIFICLECLEGQIVIQSY